MTSSVSNNLEIEIPKLITEALLLEYSIETSFLKPIQQEVIDHVRELVSVKKKVVFNDIIQIFGDDTEVNTNDITEQFVKFRENNNDSTNSNSAFNIINEESCVPPPPPPPPIWTRYNPDWGHIQRYSVDERNMRRKAEILKYSKNNSNLSKKQRYAMLAKGYLRKKKSWASQTVSSTDYNVNDLLTSGRKDPNTTPNGTLLLCDGQRTNCALTTASDVPGKPMTLCYNKKVPLENYKVKRTYLGGVGKWPQISWAPGNRGFPRGKAGKHKYLNDTFN